MNTRRFTGLCAAATILVSASLTGCSPSSGQDTSADGPVADSGSHQDVCDVLTGDLATAATAFAPALPGQTTIGMIKARIELIDSVEQPPADLSSEWKEWREYLDFAEENFELDPGAVVTKFQDVEASSDALSDFYTSTCL